MENYKLEKSNFNKKFEMLIRKLDFGVYTSSSPKMNTIGIKSKTSYLFIYLGG